VPGEGELECPEYDEDEEKGIDDQVPALQVGDR